MKSAVFLQVRLDSSRFPGKALEKLEGRTVIEHAMLSLKNIPLDDHVVLTAEGDQDTLRPLAEACGFSIFAGDRQDVLDRFIRAGRKYTPDIIIRATGDNPLVAWEPATRLLRYICKEESLDYTAMLGLPLGCGVELFRREALEKAAALTASEYDHEHVTPFIYNNPELFSLKYLEHSPSMAQRVTLDTRDDYEKLRKIYSHLYRGSTIPFSTLKEYLSKYDRQ